MSTIEDLIAGMVEDLRAYAGYGSGDIYAPAELARHAADALESQQAENERLRTEVEYQTNTKQAALGGLGRYEKRLQKVEAEREAQQAKITAALNHDPLHGASDGLHCGGMAPCIRRILSDAPTEPLSGNEWTPGMSIVKSQAEPSDADEQGYEHCLNCGERIWAGQLKADYVGRGLVHQDCSHPYGYRKEVSDES